MNKKSITLTIVSIFLCSTLFSTIAIANEENNGIFESEIGFEGDTEIKEPIDYNISKNVEIKVKYKLNIGNFAKWFFFNRRIGRMIMFGPEYFLKIIPRPNALVNLSLVDIPYGCKAELDKYLLNFTFNNEFEENTIMLTFSINETVAPALEKFFFGIKAEFNYTGNGSLKPTTNTTTISFRPAYQSLLNINVIESQEIPPLKETTIPINITNIGNGNTIVNIEVVNIPEDWNVTIDEKEINLPFIEDENVGQINLVVIPSKNFTNETLELKFTTKSIPKEDVNDTYLKGETFTLKINLENDGSLKEEEGLEINGVYIIIIIAVIVLILIAVLILRRKKQ